MPGREPRPDASARAWLAVRWRRWRGREPRWFLADLAWVGGAVALASRQPDPMVGTVLVVALAVQAFVWPFGARPESGR